MADILDTGTGFLDIGWVISGTDVYSQDSSEVLVDFLENCSLQSTAVFGTPGFDTVVSFLFDTDFFYFSL